MDSEVELRNGGAFAGGLHSAPYETAGDLMQDTVRVRKLLLHAREIRTLSARVEQKGLTVVPVKLYFRHGKVKVEIAVGRGKKLHDHRDSLKQRAEERDMQRDLSGR